MSNNWRWRFFSIHKSLVLCLNCGWFILLKTRPLQTTCTSNIKLSDKHAIGSIGRNAFQIKMLENKFDVQKDVMVLFNYKLLHKFQKFPWYSLNTCWALSFSTIKKQRQLGLATLFLLMPNIPNTYTSQSDYTKFSNFLNKNDAVLVVLSLEYLLSYEYSYMFEWLQIVAYNAISQNNRTAGMWNVFSSTP